MKSKKNLTDIYGLFNSQFYAWILRLSMESYNGNHVMSLTFHTDRYRAE